MAAAHFSLLGALTALSCVVYVCGLRNPSGHQVENAFTYKIPAHGNMCFYQEVDVNDVVELELQVTNTLGYVAVYVKLHCRQKQELIML